MLIRESVLRKILASNILSILKEEPRARRTRKARGRRPEKKPAEVPENPEVPVADEAEAEPAVTEVEFPEGFEQAIDDAHARQN